MMRFDPVRWRHPALQLGLDLCRILAGRQTRAIADPKDMRVYGKRRLAKCHVENDVCSLAPNPRQRLKRLPTPRHLTLMHLGQHLTGTDQVSRLVAIQANGANRLRQLCFTQGEHGRRGAGDSKQAARGLVHSGIGGLCREQYGDQQFKDTGELQLTCRLRVGCSECGKEGLD